VLALRFDAKKRNSFFCIDFKHYLTEPGLTHADCGVLRRTLPSSDYPRSAYSIRNRLDFGVLLRKRPSSTSDV
jgi:hypothetical protein